MTAFRVNRRIRSVLAPARLDHACSMGGARRARIFPTVFRPLAGPAMTARMILTVLVVASGAVRE